MAVVNGDPSYFIDLANTGGPTGSFQVRDDAAGSGITKFTVTNGGLVTLTNDLERSGTVVLGNTSGSTGDMVSLEQDGTERIKFSWDGTNAVLEADSPITLDNATTGSGIITRFEKNGTSRLNLYWDDTSSVLEMVSDDNVSLIFGESSGSGSTFTLQRRGTGSRNTLTTVDEAGIWKFQPDGGSVEAQLDPEDANTDCFLELGKNETRGKLKLYRDSNSPQRPGVLVLQDQDGNDVYFWVYDNNGTYEFAMRASDPGTTPAPTGAEKIHTL